MSLNSDAVNRIRLMTIATDTKPPGAWGGFAFNEWTCGQLNWNGECRPEVFQAYPTLWWVENDWAYNGQFKSKSTNTKKTAACSMGRVFDCLPYSLTFPPLQPPRAST